MENLIVFIGGLCFGGIVCWYMLKQGFMENFLVLFDNIVKTDINTFLTFYGKDYEYLWNIIRSQLDKKDLIDGFLIEPPLSQKELNDFNNINSKIIDNMLLKYDKAKIIKMINCFLEKGKTDQEFRNLIDKNFHITNSSNFPLITNSFNIQFLNHLKIRLPFLTDTKNCQEAITKIEQVIIEKNKSKIDSSIDMKHAELIYSRKLADKFLGNLVNQPLSGFDDVMQLIENYLNNIKDECEIKLRNSEKKIKDDCKIIIENVEKKIRGECNARLENTENEYKQKIESLSINDENMLLLKLNQFIKADNFIPKATGGSEITLETLNDSKVRYEVLEFIYSKLFEGASLQILGSDKYTNMPNLQYLKMIFYLINHIETSSFTFN